jgi:hypothetical protein
MTRSAPPGERGGRGGVEVPGRPQDGSGAQVRHVEPGKYQA